MKVKDVFEHEVKTREIRKTTIFLVYKKKKKEEEADEKITYVVKNMNLIQKFFEERERKWNKNPVKVRTC